MSLSPKVAAAIEKARESYLAALHKPKRPGPDWFTAAEYAKSEKIEIKAAGTRLRKMKKRVFVESQKVGRVVFWRVMP